MFSSKEEAITFAEDYGFDNAHVELLRTSGRMFESAKVLLDGGRIADAVETLLTPPRAWDRTRQAVECLISGLWQYQSFGTDYPTTNPSIVSELLRLAKNLGSDMGEQEAKEVGSVTPLRCGANSRTQIAMFKARHDKDFKTLCFLHPQFVQTRDYPAALLCLDLAFDSTLPSQSNPRVDPGPELPLHFAYFGLLDLLRREDSLATGSMRQKVFAFQPREDDRFFVPENVFLWHKIFATRPGIAQESGGCVVAHEELRRVLHHEIPEYIGIRAKQQHDACRRKLGTDPCMVMVTRGECTRHDCQFQHPRPEKMTGNWFNARVQSVLMEIRILNLTGFHPKGVVVYVLFQMSAQRGLTKSEQTLD